MKFCGIDWANDHHDALSIDENGQPLGSIRVAHSPEGLRQLDTYLERIAGPGSREQIACIVETTHGLLIAHLLERRLLLVLDNCEGLLDACRQLASSIVSRCEDVRVLCTSRQRLGVPGEATWRASTGLDQLGEHERGKVRHVFGELAHRGQLEREFGKPRA